MKKNENLFLAVVALLIIAAIGVDRFYLAGLKPEFNRLEKERIVTANELASAKIVYENLNHVRDLVMMNIAFPNQKDSINPETMFFNFLTECTNDLKMQILSVKPCPPVISGRVTKNSYDLEIEGDFFKFGELFAKLENSRRLITTESFDVTRYDDPSGGKKPKISMHVTLYRVRKGIFT
jgi:hypothetical protein